MTAAVRGGAFRPLRATRSGFGVTVTTAVATAVLTAAAGTGLAGCASAPETVTLDVAVTSSLTETLTTLGGMYEQGHKGVKLKLVFAGSQELAVDLKRTRPADVIITADGATLDAVAKRLTGRRVVLAHNSMTIAVGPGNPRRIRGLPDLSAPGIRLVIGAPSVPIGRYSQQVLSRAGVTVRSTLPAETDARSVLDRVRTGEADAGIVYVTDMKTAGAAATWVPIPAGLNVTTTYQGAVVKKSDDQEAAGAFLTWLTTPQAKAVFKRQGFATPDR